MDNLHNTAGDIVLSLSTEKCYTIIRDAGIRSGTLILVSRSFIKCSSSRRYQAAQIQFVCEGEIGPVECAFPLNERIMWIMLSMVAEGIPDCITTNFEGITGRIL